MLSYILSRFYVFVCQSNRLLKLLCLKIWVHLSSIRLSAWTYSCPILLQDLNVNPMLMAHLNGNCSSLWSKLFYLVPMFQSTFANALFLSLYWCVVSHPSWLKNERKSSGCVPVLSCINTVFPENSEGVCSFILEERLKMYPSPRHCSQLWFSSSWQNK